MIYIANVDTWSFGDMLNAKVIFYPFLGCFIGLICVYDNNKALPPGTIYKALNIKHIIHF